MSENHQRSAKIRANTVKGKKQMSKLGSKRWDGISAQARRAHALKMIKARNRITT